MNFFNKYIKNIAFLLAFALIFSAFSIFSIAKESEKSIENGLGISAKASCLIDAQSGRVLYGKNENTRLPMASTTKIMTAIVALESGFPLDTLVRVPKEAVGIEGSSIYLEEGESITLEALLYGLLLCSANDASLVIAIAVSGSVDSFVAKMNEKAASLGLSNTHFSNPHGLDDKEHYTTAKELALLMAYCSKNERFLQISGTQKRVFPRGDDSVRVMINHNRLLREDVGVIAGKTGFTKRSGRSLVTLAERDRLQLVCATIGAPDDWSDHRSLYDFGFSNYQMAYFEPISLEIPVISGKKSSVLVKSEQVSLLLAKDIETEVRVCAPKFLFAKVNEGEEAGYVLYLSMGKVIARAPLLVCEDVEQIRYTFNLFAWLTDLIKRIFS